MPDGQSGELADHEQALRHMALVPRFRRRLMGAGIVDALDSGRRVDRYARSFLPGPNEPDQATAFLFMTVAVPKFKLENGYQQYRQVRSSILGSYALALLERSPTLTRVVGIAREPPGGKGVSEDLVVVQDVVWTDELKADVAERRKLYDILVDGRTTEYAAKGQEYPVVKVGAARHVKQQPPGMNRAQRRKMESIERRRSKRVD